MLRQRAWKEALRGTSGTPPLPGALTPGPGLWVHLAHNKEARSSSFGVLYYLLLLNQNNKPVECLLSK